MAYCSWNGSEKYKDHFSDVGVYKCAKCGNDLFTAKSKYSHHTPWPAFTKTIREDSVRKEIETEPQESSNAKAMKVFCGKCGNPLGHEFIGDGPNNSSRF
ncbi:methionine-R-sulfoxide reductase B1-A-like isoform X2 [Xenia sp. Carnegie-2017]|nr:methionine-R-sulfoxide reductase B1-A-like isoform X2 [Xenia sp. Carnegie-2017]